MNQETSSNNNNNNNINNNDLNNNVDLPFFVIGAGLGRTGTKSLQEALDRLGYKTYHMMELVEGRATRDKWFDLANKVRTAAKEGKEDVVETSKEVKAVIQQILNEGYTATTDFPACVLYAEMFEYMNQQEGGKPAKVILSTRTNPERWRQSVINTIGKFSLQANRIPLRWSPLFTWIRTVTPWFYEAVGIAPFGTIDFTKSSLADYDFAHVLNDWNQQVIDNIPADQLLIHYASDGYEPICNFLEIPLESCPKSDYPRVNSEAEVLEIHKMFDRIVFGFWTLIAFVSAAVLWFVVMKLRGTDKEKTMSKNKEHSSRKRRYKKGEITVSKLIDWIGLLCMKMEIMNMTFLSMFSNDLKKKFK